MISQELKQIYQDIHKNTPFGKRAKFPKHLKEFIEEINPQTILDFGCGKGRLIDTIKHQFPNIAVSGHDPGNPEFDRSIDNEYVDLLVSSDVLEHIEPQVINDTLKFLQSKSKFAYHLIACSPAKLILPDGRNAHLIIESKEWWREKFSKLGYEILREDYKESWKTPKTTKIPMLVKNYFLLVKCK